MMRLQKFLALSGVASRRNSEKLIADGHVAVNGKVITEMGVQVDESADVVTVDGKVCKIQEEKHYLAYNKPMGEVTTVADPEGRPTVMDKFRDYPVRLYPVGRLDYDSEGLLLLTNDGELAHRLLSPKYHVEKRYFARVDGELSAADTEAFARGMTLGDGLECLPAGLEVLPDRVCIVTLREGKFHQVKRMLAARGAPVLYLKRLSMGPLTLDDSLAAGAYRLLRAEEISALYRVCDL